MIVVMTKRMTIDEFAPYLRKGNRFVFTKSYKDAEEGGVYTLKGIGKCEYTCMKCRGKMEFYGLKNIFCWQHNRDYVVAHIRPVVDDGWDQLFDI